jgi:hypothetical protein
MGSRLLSGDPLWRFAVIVTLAGWLYIINGALVLLSLRSPLPGIALTGQFGTLVLGVGLGALGVGLLKRDKWGRWFALGPSFLGWTIGALFALGMLALLFWFFANSSSFGGFAGFIGFLIVFMTVLSIVGVVINFKLYWHLVSDEGKEEFGAPESDSFVTVVQSAGVWIVASVLSMMLSGSGALLGGAALTAMLSSGEDKAQTGEIERHPEATARREEGTATREALRMEEMKRRSAEANRLYQEQLAAQAASAAAATVPNYNEQPAGAAHETVTESPAPVAYVPPEEEKPIDMRRILKCRDSSGAVQFTQGYCPNGTKEVAVPQ